MSAAEPASSVIQQFCAVCENSASSTCLECAKNYCSACSSNHIEVDRTKDHHLIEIDGKVHVFCPKHTAEEVSCVCKKCNELICNKCKQTLHINHTSEDIMDVAKKLRTQLNITLESESVKKRLDQASQRSQYQRQFQRNVEQEIQRIQVHSQSLKGEIDRIVSNMIMNLQSTRDRETNTHIHEVDASGKGSSYDGLITTAQHMLKVASDVEILQNGSTLDSEIKKQTGSSSKQTPTRQLQVKFIPAYINNLESAFGKIEIETIYLDDEKTVAERDLLPEPTLVSTIKGGSRGIRGIAVLSDMRAWITHLADPTMVYLLSSVGKIILRADVHGKVDDVVADAEGNCFVSCPDKRRINSVSTSGNVQSLVVTDQCPQGLTLLPETQELVVCLTNGETHEEGDLGENRIAKLSSYGGFFYEVASNNQCNNALGFPKRVSVNNRGMIAVSDYKNNKVLLLSPEGRPLFRYCPPQFSCCGICWDLCGGLLAANNHCFGKNSLHYLNSKGQCLRVFCKKPKGTPSSVDVDNLGNVWVGGTDGYIHVFKYK